MRLPLKIRKSDNIYFKPLAYWRDSKPFVENTRAVLIHRPLRVESHKCGKHPAHISVHYYCGNIHSGSENLTFLDFPPPDAIVCKRCEDAAIEQGIPSSTEIAGRHVCVGGVKAFKSCCKETDQ